MRNDFQAVVRHPLPTRPLSPEGPGGARDSSPLFPSASSAWKGELSGGSFLRRGVPLQECGIPKHFGLFYAMGTALMMEGLLSACYHVCPNYTNFQFGEWLPAWSLGRRPGVAAPKA